MCRCWFYPHSIGGIIQVTHTVDLLVGLCYRVCGGNYFHSRAYRRSSGIVDIQDILPVQLILPSTELYALGQCVASVVGIFNHFSNSHRKNFATSWGPSSLKIRFSMSWNNDLSIVLLFMLWHEICMLYYIIYIYYVALCAFVQISW